MKKNHSFSIIIIILSLALLCSYQIYYHFADIEETNLVKEYYHAQDNKNIDIKNISVTKSKKKEEYLGILSIPSIKLETGFYGKNSDKNNVNNSVTLLNESIMPDNNNSIIYLAAHSGSGHLAYFNNLDKLKEDDIINVLYNTKKYYYAVYDIYEMVKNGEIIVNRNINENYLVLTTCSKNNNMQLVILAKMINKM